MEMFQFKRGYYPPFPNTPNHERLLLLQRGLAVARKVYNWQIIAVAKLRSVVTPDGNSITGSDMTIEQVATDLEHQTSLLELSISNLIDALEELFEFLESIYAEYNPSYQKGTYK